VFAFSIISANIPNTYSAALSFQTLHPVFEKVPRAIWTVVVFVIYSQCSILTDYTESLAVAAVAGRQHFSTLLADFLGLIGYWIAFFIVCQVE
jgi:purine-cytosine permease-like protein